MGTMRTQNGHNEDTKWAQCGHSMGTMRTQYEHNADTV